MLGEVSETIHDFFGDMAFDQGVGPLAGKTILASLGFFISWRGGVALQQGAALSRRTRNLAD